ncbi:MAG: hypothetical protein JNM52_09995 [Betaproteobacteria bacterium]|nr:hypothetical protein [Betaproteobacteria bacterium]
MIKDFFHFKTVQSRAFAPLKSHPWRLYLAGLLCFLCGCASPPPAAPEAPATVIQPPPAPMPMPTSLTEEASALLLVAEQTVTEARIKRSLWTAAEATLELARASARRFDSVATLRHARNVIELCTLSEAQRTATPVKW